MDAELQHLRDARDAGGQLHIGDRAVADARARFGEQLQFVLVEVDAVRVPDVGPTQPSVSMNASGRIPSRASM